MGGTTKQLLSRGGEKKLGEKEERMEEWWSSRRGSSRRYIVVKFLFYFFFLRGEVSFGKSAFAIGRGHFSLSLFFKFFFRIKEKKRDESAKVTC